MKHLARRRLRRRDFVRWMGAAAFALPALELFERDLWAQAGGHKSKFAVFCYTPDGIYPPNYWPTGTETSFTLGPILAPFAPFQSKMLILGPQVYGGAPVPGMGLAYPGATEQHQAPVCLTGNATPLPYRDQSTAVNTLDGPSIDQVIAEAVKGDSPFSSLNFGTHPVGGDTPSDISFTTAGVPLKRMDSADEAFTRVFGMGVPETGPAVELHKRAAVSNYLHGRFGALHDQLSAHDRQVIDQHLTSLRSFETRIAQQLMSQDACALPARTPVPTDADSVRTGADSQTLAPFFMDVIASAFACNSTKVASMTFGWPGGMESGGLRMPWLGFTDPLHYVSHYAGDPALVDKYTKMDTWMAAQIAYLMMKLAAITDATGQTLLDQTTIYWVFRHGDGNSHGNYALPNILLGGTGGYFRMGRYLQLPATSPTKVLISIANAFGVDVPSFGKDAFMETSPLAGLAA
jgi:hypothetical protein